MTIRALEDVAAKGWRALEEARLGDWILRAAEGFTGRANSALANGDPGVPLPAAIDRVCRWYAARDLPAAVAVPYPLRGPDEAAVDRFLAERGWPIRAGAAAVMTAPAAQVARTRQAVAVDLDLEPSDAWLGLYHYRGQKPPPVARRLLMSAPFQRFASIRRGETTLAIGRVAVTGGWGGLTAVEVHPSHRRSGLATAITTALARVAARHGATRLYLQVEWRNEAARGLYARCGFTDHHGYHYRLAPLFER